MVVNPAVASSNKQLVAVPLVRRLVGSMPGIGNDIKLPGQDEVGYARTPLHALHSMVRAWKPLRRDLHDVTAPIRLWRSTVYPVVDPSSARILAAPVSARVGTEGNRSKRHARPNPGHPVPKNPTT